MKKPRYEVVEGRRKNGVQLLTVWDKQSSLYLRGRDIARLLNEREELLALLQKPCNFNIPCGECEQCEKLRKLLESESQP